MDLHIVGAEPTPDERAAVDALLGPPESGWTGGARDAERDGRMARAGLETVKDRRDLLLPALHAVQDRAGWVSRGALNYICRRLIVPPAEAWGVLTFYHLFNTEPEAPIVAHVCDDIACRLKGAERLCEQLERRVPEAPEGPREGGTSVPPFTWKRSPCLGQCDRAPAALVVRAGTSPSATPLVNIASADEILDAIEVRGASGDMARLEPSPSQEALMGLASARPAGDEALEGSAKVAGPSMFDRLAAVRQYVPWAGTPDLKLLRRVGMVDPGSLDEYRSHGGYRALARALAIGPSAVIAEVIASNLLGRGGAAFPTGRKWDAVARETTTPKFVVCNADESEPGTFKDRVLLEDDPFAIVEAMTIAGLATGATRGFIYLRGEYPRARERVQHAIDAARAARLLGRRLMGADVEFDIEIRRGAGAYICGEETALFNSLEGRRGEPRSKPPFPVQVGLFGKPTVVNNVETLINVLDILVEGGAEWARVGTTASTGTRLFCLSGHVTRPGLYELPFGRTVGELIELAGGVPGGRALQAILLGGAAGTFVGPDALSLKLTFEDVRTAGATLGSGVVMLFDETVDLRDTLLRIAKFMEDESCGQCVPCRVGTVRQVEILERLARNGNRGDSIQAARAADLATLTELGQAMRDASICGLGQTASSAVETAIARLRVFD